MTSEVARLVRDFFRRISPEDLERAIRDGFDPWGEVVRRLNLYEPERENMARVLLRAHWKDVERELLDVRRIYRRLWRRKDMRRVLSMPGAVDWLNRTCKDLYDKIYDFTWGG